MPVLTLLDTLAVQHFVFATNRLRDAVGGSALIGRLPKWVEDACAPQKLLVAGGNAWLRFNSKDEARAGVTRLSRAAHDEAPGLEFVVAHREYESGRLADALRRIQPELQKAKLARSPSAPLLGLGVTASCAETRLPATALDVEDRPIAATLAARRRPEVVAAWDRFLPPDSDKFARDGGPAVRLRFPMEMDALGRTRDDRSLMGVVHLDGNGIGGRIKAWLAEQTGSDDEVLAGLRTISDGLANAASEALAAVVRRTVAAVAHDARSGYEVRSRRLGRGFALSTDPQENAVYLPLRPIILGGDDLTFVCDGRLALDLAAAALSAFEEASVPVLGNLHACAGVAISRTHAPVLRVYELSEALCKEAKNAVRIGGGDASALDWHIGFSSPTESLEETRRRQYGRAVTMRPYRLGSHEQAGTWRWLSDVVLGVGADGLHGEAWSQRRSKVKELREFARGAPGAVARGLEAWRLSAPELRLPPGLPPDGFLDGRTPLIDAVELLDVHLPLEESTP